MKQRDLSVILFFVVLIFSNCTNPENPLRFTNGSVVKSETYALNVKDTGNVLFAKNETFYLNTFSDSLKIKTDTISYNKPVKDESDSVFGEIHQQVINTRNRNVTEVYSFIKGGVYLLGYKTSSNEPSFTRFEDPLIILPVSGKLSDSTVTEMKTLNRNASTEKLAGLKVKSTVKLIKTGKAEINNFTEDIYLYELTIIQDFSMSYGNNGLIIPDAIMLNSTLLYGSKSGLIAEWGLRNRKKTTQTPSETPEQEAYLELIKYYKLQ